MKDILISSEFIKEAKLLHRRVFYFFFWLNDSFLWGTATGTIKWPLTLYPRESCYSCCWRLLLPPELLQNLHRTRSSKPLPAGSAIWPDATGRRWPSDQYAEPSPATDQTRSTRGTHYRWWCWGSSGGRPRRTWMKMRRMRLKTMTRRRGIRARRWRYKFWKWPALFWSYPMCNWGW